MGAGAKAREEGAKLGFVRLVNAVTRGEGRLQLEINGELVHEKGYLPGSVTGGIGLKPGMYRIALRRSGVKEAETRVRVAANDTVLLVPFAERMSAGDDEIDQWAIRILRLKQDEPEVTRTATFVSVSRHPELRVEIRDPEGSWMSVDVKRLSTAKAPIKYPRGYAPLRMKGRDLSPIPIAGEGNYLVLFYDDAEGEVQTLAFRDFQYLDAD